MRKPGAPTPSGDGAPGRFFLDLLDMARLEQVAHHRVSAVIVDIDGLTAIAQNYSTDLQRQSPGGARDGPVKGLKPEHDPQEAQCPGRTGDALAAAVEAIAAKHLDRAQGLRPGHAVKVAGGEIAVAQPEIMATACTVGGLYPFAAGQGKGDVGRFQRIEQGIDGCSAQQRMIGGRDDRRPVPALRRGAHAVRQRFARFDQGHRTAPGQARQDIVDRLEAVTLDTDGKAGDARVAYRGLQDMRDQWLAGERNQALVAHAEALREGICPIARTAGQNDQADRLRHIAPIGRETANIHGLRLCRALVTVP
ncbi:hypothetical protein SPHV1_2310036 [Novosphingobium sp. KN65.2]|nr:hypothetical protein SPHV1_2310036 [Novosphingobium sp. KN65.2]